MYKELRWIQEAITCEFVRVQWCMELICERELHPLSVIGTTVNGDEWYPVPQ